MPQVPLLISDSFFFKLSDLFYLTGFYQAICITCEEEIKKQWMYTKNTNTAGNQKPHFVWFLRSPYFVNMWNKLPYLYIRILFKHKNHMTDMGNYTPCLINFCQINLVTFLCPASYISFINLGCFYQQSQRFCWKY